ncbi:MAG: hypothetical protein IKT98_09905 [Selenomonadaceae bacterium]|nr:hypothetical protein [Selenomonadaceae bacterium]
MLNTIGLNNIMQYQKASQLGNSLANQNKTADAQNPYANYSADTLVDISTDGINALEESQNNPQKDDEQKLSAKAQSYLEKLRKQYGDYNLVVSDDLDTAKTAGTDKEYSVIFTTDELEKMAEDDKYAEKVMGNVGKAVDVLKNISEKDLGEGVQFSQLSVTIDDEGNMKLFAQLEQLSKDQAARLEEAKQKRAEEKKAAEEKAQKPEAEEEEEDRELIPITFKAADVEADSEEELLTKIFGIDWSKIPDEEAYI